MQFGQQWQCYLLKGLKDSTWLNAFKKCTERNPVHQTALRFGMHQNIATYFKLALERVSVEKGMQFLKLIFLKIITWLLKVIFL